MPFLSAQPLTDDPKGLSRLKAVISTDPGYEMRAQHAEDAVLVPVSSGLPVAVPDKGASCGTLTASSIETPDPSSESVCSLVERGVTAAGLVVAGLMAMASPARDGTTAIL